MITINLLPEELRIQEQHKEPLPIAKFGVAAAVLFSIVTLYFYLDFWVATMQLSGVQKQWVQLQPHFSTLTQLRSEVEGQLAKERRFMERFVTTTRPVTHMLSLASQHIPPTAWLLEFDLKREVKKERLLIKGYMLPTKEQSSIELIEIYLQQLKEKLSGSNLTLTTTRRKEEGVELMQFVALFEWALAEGEGAKA